MGMKEVERLVDCDREKNGNERGRGYCDRSTSRHVLYCQLLTFSYYSSVPKPVTVMFMWEGISVSILVRKVCRTVNNTTYF